VWGVEVLDEHIAQYDAPSVRLARPYLSPDRLHARPADLFPGVSKIINSTLHAMLDKYSSAQHVKSVVWIKLQNND
jgi:hypothetical protein